MANKVKFYFYDDSSNKSVLLNGYINAISNKNSSSKTAEVSSTPVPGFDPYDSTGAMTYVVAVIVVYGMSVFFIVATLIRRKSHNKSLDSQVSRYIKGLEAARNQAKLECVLRTRLKWPGNFIQFGTREWEESCQESDKESDQLDSVFNEENKSTQNKLENNELPRELQTHIPDYMRQYRRHRSQIYDERHRQSDRARKPSRHSAIYTLSEESEEESSYEELPATTVITNIEDDNEEDERSLSDRSEAVKIDIIPSDSSASINSS